MILSSLINIFARKAEFDKRKGIYFNGSDNDYPERIDRLINNSVTAKRSANVFKSFIVGKGFEAFNDFVVNKSKGLTILQALSKAASDITRQGGVFFHVKYDINANITSIDILPYSHCRIGKKDDDNYNGKILIKDWNDTANKKEPLILDVYNSNKKVILSQIARDGIQQYKGQVLFVNESNYIYPLSRLDAVSNDAESENQVSVYKNLSLTKGFFGKTLIITQPFTDGEMDVTSKEYIEADTERENFRNNIQNFIGASNADGVMHLEMDLVEDDIDKTVLFKNIESNIDDKIFAHTENSIRENITIAFGVPKPLIVPAESNLFSGSGESIIQMKKFVQEESTFERELLEGVFKKLMSRFVGFEMPEVFEITKLIQDVSQPNTDSNV